MKTFTVFLLALVATAAFLLASCQVPFQSPVASVSSGDRAVAYAPVAVPKTQTKKVYIHVMPWFETKASSGNNTWGAHWTMANKNPDIIDGTGKRQIASYYYPQTGPYASGDPDIVEYQLLLMKYAGADGILIDWPGTVNAWDYAKNRQNSEVIINKTAQVGLNFAIVYEDHNIGMAYDAGLISNKIASAQADMTYLKNNYTTKNNYIQVNGAPLLLDFGPQTFVTESDWTSIFSTFSTKPTFMTLWYQIGQPGINGKGEYAWIYSDGMAGLDNFYNNHPLNLKFGVGYPGFNTFYNAGGWSGPTWTIPVNTSTFGTTLDKALAANDNAIQLATWNDYGEGTMIEPTQEFGYSFLTTLQQKLGVSSSQSDLQLIYTLYQQRKQYAGNATKQDQLDQAFYDLASNQVSAAASILNGAPPPPPPAQGPYGGTNRSIADGAVIQAEDYDVGGENVAYHDNEAANQGGQYRTGEGVDVETSGDVGGGYDVGWTNGGEWLKYTTNVTAGTYNVVVRFASGISNPGTLALSLDGVSLGTVQAPATGGWQTWQDVTLSNVTLSGGNGKILRLDIGGGYNINSVKFTSVGTPPPPPPPTQGPYGGTNRSIADGAVIQAEDYNVGGEAVAYHDNEAANQGGQYRTGEGVDVETSGDAGGGYDVGWTNSGEWLKYTTNVTAGTYNIVVRFASGISNPGTLALSLDGVSLGTVQAPATGGWQTWQDATLSNVTLSAGTGKILRLDIGGGYNVNYVKFVLAGSTPPPPPPPSGTTSYYIKNIWKGTYLYASNGQVAYAATTNGDASKWVLEDKNGFKRIKNLATGLYMNIEHQYSYVECSSVPDTYYSGYWTLETVSGNTRFKNAWQSTYLNVENQSGFAQCSSVPDTYGSSQWTLIQN